MIKVKGIKKLKFWLNVRDIVIQYIFVRKYPKPNNHPYRKKNFLYDWKSSFLYKNTKNILKVKKLIKKRLNGGRLNELKAPNKINI